MLFNCGYGKQWTGWSYHKEVLKKVNEDRQMLGTIWQWGHQWTSHVLRHNGLLYEIITARIINGWDNKRKQKTTSAIWSEKKWWQHYKQQRSAREKTHRQWCLNLLYNRKLIGSILVNPSLNLPNLLICQNTTTEWRPRYCYGKSICLSVCQCRYCMSTNGHIVAFFNDLVDIILVFRPPLLLQNSKGTPQRGH